MSKQIKIGFDKTPAPRGNFFEPLYDILTAEKLKDNVGNDIFTQVKKTSSELQKKNKALSLSLNNKTFDEILPTKVSESFANDSEVSKTLLGIDRSETQLSLFSDVSTYGLDETNWEFYEFRQGQVTFPIEWFTRKHPIYGNRKFPVLIEGVDEQALYIEAFPVNYTFPFGPSWEERGRYNENLFRQYLRFIAAGRILYEFYKDQGYEFYAKNNFLNENVNLVDLAGNTKTVTSSSSINEFVENTDVLYEGNISETFSDIEKFTLNFFKIQNETFNFLSKTSFENQLNSILQDIQNNIGEMSPGYRSNNTYFGTLESKQSFRYQPGRISGFTFGVRVNTDENSTSNYIEWGCSNDTDEYLFQIRGSEFNIVRRSTISLQRSGSGVFERLNMSPESEIQVRKNGVNNSDILYELAIPREKFNGDTLDGNGPSGYVLSFDDVTMYKIEFGWYGAIGAKFYAYIPVGNGEARWVLIHTLVIENSLNEPCLKNPNFKFKYSVFVADTSRILEPIYIYKYGSSYYIDGGDEGTLQINGYVSTEKPYNFETLLFGFHPKNEIENFLVDEVQNIPNDKESYLEKLSVFSNNFSEISVVEITGSSEGQHFHYSPSIQNDKNPETKEIDLTLSSDGKSFQYSTSEANGINITSDDISKKIIADGIYNCYITSNASSIVSVGDIVSFPIERRNQYDFEEPEEGISNRIKLFDGSSITDSRERTFNTRITGYDTIVASNTSLNENEFKIHFLNPVKKDEETFGKHFADFAIGVTYLKPKFSSSNSDLVVFEDEDLNENELSIYSDEVLFLDWSQFGHNLDLSGFENSEWDPTRGIKLDIDYRLPRPDGSDSGVISAIKGNLSISEFPIEGEIEEISGGKYKIKTAFFPTEEIIFEKTEIGIDNQRTGFFITNIETEIQDELELKVITVENSNTSAEIDSSTNSFQLKRITLSTDSQIEYFDNDGNPVLNFKNISKTKALSFGINSLYVMIGLTDYAEVNNIIFEEIGTRKRSYTPQWLVNSDKSSIIKNSGGSTQQNSPVNFLEENRLNSLKVDTQTTQPLRPGKKIASFYTDPNKSKKIDLSNIFSYDKNKITRGSFNNKITVITAKPVASEGGGQMQSSIIVKER